MTCGYADLRQEKGHICLISYAHEVLRNRLGGVQA
jgi:hypothetical protein